MYRKYYNDAVSQKQESEPPALNWHPIKSQQEYEELWLSLVTVFSTISM